MPSGYTADVQSGKITEFEHFAMQCARAFGALIHMRDDNMGEELRPREASTYHRDGLKDDKEELERVKKMDAAAIKAIQTQRHKENVKYHTGSIAENKLQRTRYQDMIDKVEAWTPPTDEHVDFKEFMLRQLNESLEFDCNDKYHLEGLEKDERTPAEWREDKIKDLERSIERHEEEWEKEQERVADANQWVIDLVNSLTTR